MKPTQPQPSQFNSSQRVQIEKPIYGGAFLARVEGKAVFVPLTLPGEQALVRIVQDKRGYATAEVDQLIGTAPQRVSPGCRHFDACGGCHYQHANYATQLEIKHLILRETLERGGVKAPETIDIQSGEPWGYRNRVRMAFDVAGNVGYRARRSHSVIPISECPIAAPLLVRAARAAAELWRALAPALRPTEIALFCNADESALLVSVFIPHHPANLRFDEFAHALAEQVPALRGAELVVDYRAEKQKPQSLRTIARWGANSLTYSASGFDFRVDHGAFFQVNRWLVDSLVERVAAASSGELAWDLFAGVGLFARALSSRFTKVVAVESAPAATAALEHNLHGTTGTGVSAETLAFLRHNKTQRPDLIVVDPPRTGLGAEITSLLSTIAAPSLTYVSCDPATLARDLRALIGSGYAIGSLALTDLFPQTFHLETVVHLHRS